MDTLTPLKLKNIKINHSPNPLSISPRTLTNSSQNTKSKKNKTQQLIFSKMPLSMKKQFLHILRTNDLEFRPSIRHGFVETKIRMTDT